MYICDLLSFLDEVVYCFASVETQLMYMFTDHNCLGNEQKLYLVLSLNICKHIFITNCLKVIFECLLKYWKIFFLISYV